MNIYHYTNIHGLLGILNSNTFWISKSTFMNDPGEIEYAWKLYQAEIGKHEGADLFRPLINWIDGILRVQDIFILSLSKDKDSLSLWSRYGQGHGYSIEIDMDKLIAEINDTNLKIPFKAFFDVSYEQDFLKKYVEAHMEKYYKAQKVNKNYPIDSEQTVDLMFNVLSSLFAFKHKAYADEKEIRGIFIIPNRYSLVTDSIWDDNVSFRIQDNRIIPFITLKMNNLNWIKGIILGPLNKEERDLEGIDLLLKSKKLKINVTKSEVPYR